MTRLAIGELKAGDESRTRDLLLGKQTLYQLSYPRTDLTPIIREKERNRLSSPASRRTLMEYDLVIHAADEGGYWAEVPVLEGCFIQGGTVEEVLEDAPQAIAS